MGEEPHAPYDRPPLSKQLLGAEWEPERLALRAPAELDGLDLDLRLGVAATGLDATARTVLLADGTQLSYDGLIVATGVRPRRLPGERDAHVLRTLDDALALRDRLKPGRRLVVGGWLRSRPDRDSGAVRSAAAEPPTYGISADTRPVRGG